MDLPWEALGNDVNSVAGFGVPVTLSKSKTPQNLIYSIFHVQVPIGLGGMSKWLKDVTGFADLLYPLLGVRNGHDRKYHTREIESMELSEVVLIAQDLASYGRDLNETANMQKLYEEVSKVVKWVHYFTYIPQA